MQFSQKSELALAFLLPKLATLEKFFPKIKAKGSSQLSEKKQLSVH
jgi:hypothetical protein